jgi:hypothetical protein
VTLLRLRVVKDRFDWLRPDPRRMLTASVLVLIAANLVPIYGALALGWQVFPILLLFWIENVIVGLFNVLKMVSCSPRVPLQWAAKVFAIPFFCVHYGMFTLVHGMFVIGLFGGYFLSGADFPDPASFLRSLADLHIGWGVLALLLSHSVSFALNYIGKGEFRKATVSGLMGQPYGRVVVLHLTILFGGFGAMELGSPVFVLVLLIALKTFVDVQAHLREHSSDKAAVQKGDSVTVESGPEI